MKRYSNWIMAGVVLTTLGVLTGCGSATNGASPTTGTNATSNAALTTNTTSTESSTNTTGATSNTNVASTTSTTNTVPSSNSTSSDQGQNGAPQQVYVFSQPMLEEMYAVEYFRSVGPIIPPQSVENGVTKWAPKVSMNMLPYAPPSERALDKLLIQNIERSQQTAQGRNC